MDTRSGDWIAEEQAALHRVAARAGIQPWAVTIEDWQPADPDGA